MAGVPPAPAGTPTTATTAMPTMSLQNLLLGSPSTTFITDLTTLRKSLVKFVLAYYRPAPGNVLSNIDTGISGDIRKKVNYLVSQLVDRIGNGDGQKELGALISIDENAFLTELNRFQNMTQLSTQNTEADKLNYLNNTIIPRTAPLQGGGKQRSSSPGRRADVKTASKTRNNYGGGGGGKRVAAKGK